MSLSSNSIIHFTNNSAALKGILKDNFKLSYCLESPILDNRSINFYVPMVSFCDIPLSEVKEHITKYGPYGLGLTKEWAERKRLNPVLYIDKNSELSKSYRKVYFDYAVKSGKLISELNETEICLVDILRYIKSYQADLVRGGQVINEYRFSDEREWRYLPKYEEGKQFICSKELFEEHKVDIVNAIKNDRLEFEPNDIKYIIIESENEISEFLDLLKTTKGKAYSYHDVERLMTRIITTEQIIKDF